MPTVATPALTRKIAGELPLVSPGDNWICCNNHGPARARLGKDGVHPYFQCIQTSTPREPQT